MERDATLDSYQPHTKAQTLPTPKRDQLTGESRNYWRRSFDSEQTEESEVDSSSRESNNSHQLMDPSTVSGQFIFALATPYTVGVDLVLNEDTTRTCFHSLYKTRDTSE